MERAGNEIDAAREAGQPQSEINKIYKKYDPLLEKAKTGEEKITIKKEVGGRSQELGEKPPAQPDKIAGVLSRLKTLKKERVSLTEKETALKSEFEGNVAKLETLIPDAKGGFKRWVNRSVKANKEAVKQIASGEISELKANQVMGIMINFANILKANAEYKAKQESKVS